MDRRMLKEWLEEADIDWRPANFQVGQVLTVTTAFELKGKTFDRFQDGRITKISDNGNLRIQFPDAKVWVKKEHFDSRSGYITAHSDTDITMRE